MATRAQTTTQVTWSAASTKSIAIGGAMNYSDDFTFSGNLIDKEITVTANSSGTASDDIVEIHMGVKKTRIVPEAGPQILTTLTNILTLEAWTVQAAMTSSGPLRLSAWQAIPCGSVRLTTALTRSLLA